MPSQADKGTGTWGRRQALETLSNPTWHNDLLTS